MSAGLATRGRGTRALVSGILAVTTLVSGRARADVQGARELFEQGRVRAQQGDLVNACDAFRRSHAEDPQAIGPELNLASCEHELGHWLVAESHFQAVLDRLPEDDYRRTYAAEQVVALLRAIPSLVVRSPDPSGASVVVARGESTQLQPLGSVTRKDPGKYRVTLSRDAVVVASREVDVRPGTLSEVVFPSSFEPRAVDGASRRRDPTLAWALGGIGAAFVATGTTTGLLAFDSASTFRGHCDARGACDEVGTAAARAGEWQTVVSTASFAVGAACVGAAIYWALRGGPRTTSGK